MSNYEQTVYDILEKDIGLILPKFEDREKNINQMPEKTNNISFNCGFIGLAFEGISSFLQHKAEKALQQAMHTMNKTVNTVLNRVFHFKDSMIMYDVIQCRHIRYINTDGT